MTKLDVSLRLEQEVIATAWETSVTIAPASALRIADMKFRSSITLFSRAAREAPSRNWLFGEGVFEAALKKYFGGEPDQATLERIVT